MFFIDLKSKCFLYFVPQPEEAPAPAPSHKASPDKTPEETTPAPADGCDPAADKEKAVEDDTDKKEKEEPVAA